MHQLHLITNQDLIFITAPNKFGGRGGWNHLVRLSVFITVQRSCSDTVDEFFLKIFIFTPSVMKMCTCNLISNSSRFLSVGWHVRFVIKSCRPLITFLSVDCPCTSRERHSGRGWPSVGSQNVLFLPGSAESIPYHGVFTRR